MIPIDRLILTKRKTIALIVESDGSLTVRAPRNTDRSLIEEFVGEKTEWINRHREQPRQSGQPPEHRYQSGESFYFLGQVYPLSIVDRSRPTLDLEDGEFVLSNRCQLSGKTTFTEWYRKQARAIIPTRLKTLAAQYNDYYRSVRITSAATRWGSCSAKNSLNFSWRLVMAPYPIIDYVIIHELVHLKIKNHSPVFWQAMSVRMPDYRTRREWLRKNTKHFAL